MQSRRPTFLARSEWIKTPFSMIGLSSVQYLVSQVAILPLLLNKIDQLLGKHNPPADVSEAVQLLNQLLCVMERLHDLETSFKRTSDGSPCWNELGCFRDVTSANLSIHLCAFYIVCLEEVEKLATAFPCLIPQEGHILSLDGNTCCWDAIPDNMLGLCRHILLATEYLLQDNMMLFGPISSLFPLRMAYTTFTRCSTGGEKNITYLATLIKRIEERGVGAAASYITRNVP